MIFLIDFIAHVFLVSATKPSGCFCLLCRCLRWAETKREVAERGPRDFIRRSVTPALCGARAAFKPPPPLELGVVRQMPSFDPLVIGLLGCTCAPQQFPGVKGGGADIEMFWRQIGVKVVHRHHQSVSPDLQLRLL